MQCAPKVSSTQYMTPKKSTSHRVTRLEENPSGGGRPRQIQSPQFPFMELPLELRRQIYSLILPSQDVPRRSGRWADIVGIPNNCMNLLLANRQISEEARTVFYGLNSFTMSISRYVASLLGRQQTLTSPSLAYIKNWQLCFHSDMDRYEYGHMRDALLQACAALAKVPDLQTLKISIPCFCWYIDRDSFLRFGYRNDDAGHQDGCRCIENEGEDACCCIDLEGIHEGVVCTLASLNQLRFKNGFQVITHPLEDRSPQQMIEDPERLSRIWNQQCQKPACLSFASSFEPFGATLRGRSTPLSLISNQAEWLKLEHDVKNIIWGLPWSISGNALCDVWKALQSTSDEYFEKTVEGAWGSK
ncbi:MAG: hypothetical protein Q9216_005930 [Gyalolechia sp. 2 TL-2023]